MASLACYKVYSNAPAVKLELNGALVAPAQKIPKYGMATFDSIKFSPGKLTAVALGEDAVTEVASYSVFTPGTLAKLELTLDAPSVATGTGSALLLDCQDTAMVRASLIDSNGHLLADSNQLNVSFAVLDGPGRVKATHNGDPANTSPSLAAWTPSYYGLARAFVQTTSKSSTSTS